ncbi:MAG: roadblock/LC7 domain-containing protein [Actinobacteria bacterium]|nr:roadblock/LC7 domain-containing protein [Actinomycetota bacterium]
MSEELEAWLPVEERVRNELRHIREYVAGVHGSLTATSDGLLIAHDLPDQEPTQIAALVATTLALGSRMTLSTGRGQFRETVTRGTDGYLAVYAAGRSSIVAVIGTPRLNVGMLQYQVRDIIDRIAAYSTEFGTWASPATVRTGADEAHGRGDSGPEAQPVLPERRRPAE